MPLFSAKNRAKILDADLVRLAAVAIGVGPYDNSCDLRTLNYALQEFNLPVAASASIKRLKELALLDGETKPLVPLSLTEAIRRELGSPLRVPKAGVEERWYEKLILRRRRNLPVERIAMKMRKVLSEYEKLKESESSGKKVNANFEQ